MQSTPIWDLFCSLWSPACVDTFRQYWHLWVGCNSWFSRIIYFFSHVMPSDGNHSEFFSLSFWRNANTCCVERFWNYWSSLPSSHRSLCVDLVVLCFIYCHGLFWFFLQNNVVSIIIRSAVLILGLSFFSGLYVFFTILFHLPCFTGF